MSDQPILFFDGVCGLCNRVVDRLIALDKNGVLKFAPLQGETAMKSLQKSDRIDLDSVVFLKNAKVFKRSRAVAQALNELGGSPRILARMILIVPMFIADWFYDRVASSRYRIWGKRETCRIPTASERARILP